MRVDNIRWHPIRLGLRRVRSQGWWVSREGVVLGEIRKDTEGWFGVRGQERKLDQGNALLWEAFGECRYSSFVTAALAICRFQGVGVGSDALQDLGEAHVLRINVATRWYTVLVKGDESYLYEDHTIKDKRSDSEQRRLRAVLSEVTRWKRK